MVIHPGNFSSDIEAVNVVAQLGDLLRRRIEVVARIEGVIAEKLPCFGVKLLSSGLDDRADLRSGCQTILSAVVRGQIAKLCNRVDGRHDAAAAAAAVEILATINQLQVMTGPLAVDAHSAVTADRSEGHTGTLETGCSGGQSEQFIQAAAIGGELSDLLSGDDIALFAAISLYSDRIRLHGHVLLHAAYHQLEIDTRPVPNSQHQILLFRAFEARRRGAHVVTPNNQ